MAALNVRAPYDAALLKEIREHRWEWLPNTVYFGGGTPSLMTPALLADVMKAIPSADLREATIECAPGTIRRELAMAWRLAGINRVSLGVQSFVGAELHYTGRRHTAETVREDIELLRGCGLGNINLDLIAGLPAQTEASWEESLDWIGRLNAPHVSVYLYEIDEDSRLGREVLAGGARYGAQQMPSDDMAAALYERAGERLRDLGYMHYEISNFAHPGCESLHNLKYWQLEPYVGFGLDAHSYDGHERWSNPDSLTEYFRRGAPNRISTDRAQEHLFVGLRLLGGIQPTSEEWQRFAAPIEKWIKAGMLERAGARLKLTTGAVLVSNEIFEEFLI